MEKTFAAQKKWVAKNKNKGMSRVNVWVPDDRADEIKAVAAKMRKTAPTK